MSKVIPLYSHVIAGVLYDAVEERSPKSKKEWIAVVAPLMEIAYADSEDAFTGGGNEVQQTISSSGD